MLPSCYKSLIIIPFPHRQKDKAFIILVNLKMSCLYVYSFYLRQPTSQGNYLMSEWKAIPQSFMNTLFEAYIVSFKAQLPYSMLDSSLCLVMCRERCYRDHMELPQLLTYVGSGEDVFKIGHMIQKGSSKDLVCTNTCLS